MDVVVLLALARQMAQDALPQEFKAREGVDGRAGTCKLEILDQATGRSLATVKRPMGKLKSLEDAEAMARQVVRQAGEWFRGTSPS